MDMGIEEVIKTLKEQESKIKQKYKVRIKGIFGSFVRQPEEGSNDIDILVDFDAGADLFDFVGLSLFLEDKLKHKVDIVPEKYIRDEIKENILGETVRI